ncbi:MAG: hypothetical protein RBS53_09090 [Bacteroidales bacterium]|nr:hypothetical protein [Bacteroidales bacterium]NLM91950.1 hypothetical protein [Bacteroidales bacterium]
MKIKKRLFSLFGLLTLSAVIITACQKDQATIDKQDNIVVMSTPVSGSGVTPQIIDGENGGGNRTCGEVAEAFKTSFDLSVGQYNYEDGVFDNEWPEGLTVTTDGTYVSFTVDGTIRIEGMCYIVGAVIVKGGNDANVYYYADGTLSDTGLSAPVNASGGPAGLSNLSFCLYAVDCPEEEECWAEETAWAGNVAGGGPAWWYYIDTQAEGTYPLYAGQQLIEGASVTIAEGLLTINLGENLALLDVSEPVKIQAYTTIPTRRPAAGLFKTYKGSATENISVGNFPYYAVHLDALVKVECPE